MWYLAPVIWIQLHVRTRWTRLVVSELGGAAFKALLFPHYSPPQVWFLLSSGNAS